MQKQFFDNKTLELKSNVFIIKNIKQINNLDLVGMKQVLIICDYAIAKIYKKIISPLFGKKQCWILIPSGEANKNIFSVQNIIDLALAKKLNRNDYLIAFGGGLISDLVGFCAAIYKRGINVIYFPTTMLANVDAAIGAKTAINHAQGKNQIGSFYEAKQVIICLEFLETLDSENFTSALSEVIKIALVADKTFFLWLEKNINLILQKDKNTITYLLEKSLKLKDYFVKQDKKEQGIRVFLNFGHTLAHAIETLFIEKNILHGQAVGYGILYASYISLFYDFISEKEYKKIRDLIQNANILPKKPIKFNEAQVDKLIKIMLVDKKNDSSEKKIRFVLLKNIGQAQIKYIENFEFLKKCLSAINFDQHKKRVSLGI